MRVWLDDVRPAPDGWVELKTYLQFVDFMTCPACLGSFGLAVITEMSLDHDLGADCTKCWGQVGEGYEGAPSIQICGGSSAYQSGAVEECTLACGCHKTGYDVVSWMEETGNWPPNPPTVHSMNPVGRQRMLQVIQRHYGG